MKHIIFPLAFAAMAWSATAQDSTSARAHEQQDACVTSEMTKVLATLPAEKMVGSTSEQGRDKLDSTYYLDTKVYELPYKSKKERQQVERLTASLVKAYDADIKHHTGGARTTPQRVRNWRCITPKTSSPSWWEGKGTTTWCCARTISRIPATDTYRAQSGGLRTML